MVKLLLSHKADVDIKCADGFLPIDTTVINHNFKMIKLLLSNGSTLTQKSLNMFIAGECNGDSIKTLELFVRNGIDLDHYSKNNNIIFVELMQEDNCFAAIELIKADKLAIEIDTSIEQNTSILA